MPSRLRVLTILTALAIAPVARALDFAPCTDADQQGFECATLTVPLDRSGAVSGSVPLAIERLPAKIGRAHV